MPYKDPDKQREAVRDATRRYRAKGITPVSHKSITKVSQEQSITDKSCDTNVIPHDGEAMMCVHKVGTRPEPHGCKGCKLMVSYGWNLGLGCPKGKASTLSWSIFEQAVNPKHDCTREAA